MTDETFHDKYTLKSEIGRGAFSVVHMGINKETGEKVAVKVIERNKIDPKQQVSLDREVDILTKVSHPHIIHLLEIFDAPECVYLVMELVTGGELFDRIVDKGCYSEAQAVDVVRKMLQAVQYLHKEGICHRDLKPENLLLAKATNDVDIKIADFGLSKLVSTKLMMQTACGTPGYVAPEVLAATGYGPEVDLWSVGVITYILLCGFPPFYGEQLGELFEQILAGIYDYPEEYWGQVSANAKDFIDHLLVVDVEERYTAEQALAHPWLREKASNRILSLGKVMAKTVIERRRSSAVQLAKQSEE